MEAIPTVEPKRFYQVLTGSTRPWLALCEADNGEEMEVVVKPTGTLKRGSFSRASELAAALLAAEFGLNVAKPVLVRLDRGFAASIYDANSADAVHRSIGLNFGSVLAPAGANVWPVENSRGLPPEFSELSAKVFAFDVWTQNYDRQADNPNLLTMGREILLIDHEMAFSPADKKAEGFTLNDLIFNVFYRHVFYHGKGALLPAAEALDRFLQTLDSDKIGRLRTFFPQEWSEECDSVERIFRYVDWACRERASILDEVTSRFA